MKIIKLRKMYNLEREEFADLIGHHWTTVNQWEKEGVLPKPESIKDICNAFNLSLQYFHEYYHIYFNNPGEKIKEWRIKNNLTYQKAADIVGMSYSGFARLLSGKINLSYNMYLKLKKLGAF
ncbi:DNA-binding transcriptional regulator, XRE-family HTH domain [Clostridium sp. USBA 49]|uniref:helix-turn-helix domain-containing protein n=1 Tax=Clostridium sp. USBA 49 TaxID=1881060 RepID=UPI0009D5E5A1|nr:helix-turn-helix transcriptional regulator [Clostridium sp. USBA 49]SKA89837.1 DNA-binding transcriptional regulator, XRE-family HTH domain [Clostridium sp. USBA 49]